MADRFPLILNTSANQIQEIASGDQLDLSGNNIANAGVITATTFSGSIAGASNGILGIITAAAADIDDFIEVGSNIQLGNAGVVTATTFKGNGDFVELDVDGHTNLDNVSIAGLSTHSEGIFIPDSKELKIGQTAATPDLKIYSDGSNGYIREQGPGSLYLQGINLVLENTSGSNYFAGVSGAEAIIYYNGNPKLTTTNTGINITGSVVSDGLVVDGNSDLNGDLDVDGHTNLDNVNVVGVVTVTGAVNASHSTFGNLNTTGITIENTNATILFQDTNNNPDYWAAADNGVFDIVQYNNGGSNINVVKINTDGHIDIATNVDFAAGIDVTGNVIASGNVSGVNGVFSGNVSVGGVLTYEDVTNVDSVGIVTARNGIKVLAGGANVVGVVTATGGVFVPDNNQIQLGNAAGSADLKIYHDTSDSIIHQDGTGDLRIRSDNSIEFNTNGTQNAIWCDSGAAVKLYYNNGLKLATTDDGIDVTGQVVADSASFTDDGSSSPTVKIFTDDANPYALNIGNSSYNASSPFGLNFFNNNSGEGYFRHIGNGSYKDYHFSLHDNSSNKLCIKFEADDQSVELYAEGNKKLETTSDGATITGNLKPDADSTRFLGSNGVRFSKVFADVYEGSGANLTGIDVGITTEQVTPSSNVATLNLAKDDHKIVASGTYTIDVSGGTEAESHTLRIENSGTANVGFSTYFKFPSGGTPSLPTASGAISLISFSVHKVGSVGIATVLLSGASVNYS